MLLPVSVRVPTHSLTHWQAGTEEDGKSDRKLPIKFVILLIRVAPFRDVDRISFLVLPLYLYLRQDPVESFIGTPATTLEWDAAGEMVLLMKSILIPKTTTTKMVMMMRWFSSDIPERTN